MLLLHALLRLLRLVAIASTSTVTAVPQRLYVMAAVFANTARIIYEVNLQQ